MEAYDHRSTQPLGEFLLTVSRNSLQSFASLALPCRVRSFHSCAHPLATFSIAPTSNMWQQQTYVLAALYEL
jgi:hypothetical protein